MQNGDFELGGYLMGAGQPVFISDFSPGTVGARDQDTDNPYGDTRLFGRDRRTPPIWSFEFSVAEKDGAAPDTGVLQSLEELIAAWSTTVDALQPGEVTALRYMIGGRIRRVYGRPRNLSFNPSANIAGGNVVASGQFILQDVFTYGDQLHDASVTLRNGPVGWVTLPAVWPLISTVDSTRQGTFVVGSAAAGYPEDITFYGPVVNPHLRTMFWDIELTASIPEGGWVRIDPRARLATFHNGVSAGNVLSRHTYLPDLTLRPGSHGLIYSGHDSTGTSRAVVRWRNAYLGL